MKYLVILALLFVFCENSEQVSYTPSCDCEKNYNDGIKLGYLHAANDLVDYTLIRCEEYGFQSEKCKELYSFSLVLENNLKRMDK